MKHESGIHCPAAAAHAIAKSQCWRFARRWRAKLMGTRTLPTDSGRFSPPHSDKFLGSGSRLLASRQWSGINVIFNYAEDIYRSAGYGISGILFNIVITGTINLVFTLLALGLVDRVGRRALMLFGAAGIRISHTLLGFTYRAGIQGLPILLLTLCTIGFYALSLAPVTWVLISELFPNRIRSFGV